MAQQIQVKKETGINVPVELSPREVWALKYLDREGSKIQAGCIMLYRDKKSIFPSFEEGYSAVTRSSVWAAHNVARIIYSLQSKGLVEIRELPCPFHPTHKKLFVFLTPEGRQALWALQEK